MSHFIYCYAECCYAGCDYAECHYAECRGPDFKSVNAAFKSANGGLSPTGAFTINLLTVVIDSLA
jgi:hypothetical protein